MFALFLSLPASLLAGGPPWLCLPLEGVTSQNAAACGELLTTRLKDKLWKHGDREARVVKIQQHAGQWYATFFMGEQVALSEVEQSLKGSDYSVPRSRLRLFGHVELEIDAGQARPQELLIQLKGLKHVSVENSTEKGGRLLVTVDMPYPSELNGREDMSMGFDTFKRCDFSSDQSTRSEKPVTAAALPGYDTFRDLVAKQNASLKEVSWDPNYACRPLGAVAVVKSSKKETTGKSAAR
jgi:hypothetical protein